LPCPNCGSVGQFGNIGVSGDVLRRGCNACGDGNLSPLPKLQTTVIYIDQFFLSHVFRKEQKPFVEVAARIADLAQRQLLVCPSSSAHELETHLWGDERRDSLWGFIKRSARQHEFRHTVDIRKPSLTAPSRPSWRAPKYVMLLNG
jgi:hypothetical protein